MVMGFVLEGYRPWCNFLMYKNANRKGPFFIKQGLEHLEVNCHEVYTSGKQTWLSVSSPWMNLGYAWCPLVSSLENFKTTKPKPMTSKLKNVNSEYVVMEYTVENAMLLNSTDGNQYAIRQLCKIPKHKIQSSQRPQMLTASCTHNNK